MVVVVFCSNRGVVVVVFASTRTVVLCDVLPSEGRGGSGVFSNKGVVMKVVFSQHEISASSGLLSKTKSSGSCVVSNGKNGVERSFSRQNTVGGRFFSCADKNGCCFVRNKMMVGVVSKKNNCIGLFKKKNMMLVFQQIKKRR